MSKEYSEVLENLKQQAIAFEHNELAIKVANGNYTTLKEALQRLEAIDNANPSEALESLNEMYELACDSRKPEYGLYECIKQALLKAQEDEKENEFLSSTIATVSKQYTDLMLEYQEQKRVLEILKPHLRLVGNYLQVKVDVLFNCWVVIKEIVDEEELELLKRCLGEERS